MRFLLRPRPHAGWRTLSWAPPRSRRLPLPVFLNACIDMRINYAGPPYLPSAAARNTTPVNPHTPFLRTRLVAETSHAWRVPALSIHSDLNAHVRAPSLLEQAVK
jgi:hypothetical protein